MSVCVRVLDRRGTTIYSYIPKHSVHCGMFNYALSCFCQRGLFINCLHLLQVVSLSMSLCIPV